MNNMSNDTIAAVSTPLGEGGISVIRMSGKDSLNILSGMFFTPGGKNIDAFISHKARYGHIRNPEGKVIDEVVVTVMKSPGSYTAEDVVEISCHGGISCVKNILELCMSGGARLAGPGEFTKRAFLNGRIDLAQAEAVREIITSESDSAREMAMDHLRGGFSGKIYDIKNKLLDILSRVELKIDFSDEDVPVEKSEAILAGIRGIKNTIDELAGSYSKGVVLRNGINVVICGRPNVGKSSLMNALLRHDRVIVTSEAGTTRDIIEEVITIGGVRVRLSDTAGIIETRNRVEMEGIKRSREKLESADIVLFMLDNSRTFTEKDRNIFLAIKEKNVIPIVNKIDLAGKLNMPALRKNISRKKILKMSVLRKKGIEAVEDAISDVISKKRLNLPGGSVVSNLRHKTILEEIRGILARTIKKSAENFNAELAASDLNEAVFQLEQITGESCRGEVLNRIFSNFCIGK